MSLPVETLTEQALALPADQRALLADKLVESLDPAEEVGIRAAWMAEIDRRIADVESGRTKTIPAEQVFAEIHAMLNRDR
jgi:putative addiction module component (TIGR02574 family)